MLDLLDRTRREFAGFAHAVGVGKRSPAGTAPSPAQAKKRATWAELLKRVFEIDVLTCPWCGGQRRLIALITDGALTTASRHTTGFPGAVPPRTSSAWNGYP